MGGGGANGDGGYWWNVIRASVKNELQRVAAPEPRGGRWDEKKRCLGELWVKGHPKENLGMGCVEV